MHTASKVMLILGAVITVAGIVMFVGGSAAIDSDPIADSEWSGSTGTFSPESDSIYTVMSTVSSCDEITYTIEEVDGSGWADSIDNDNCDDSMYSVNGYITLGSLWNYADYSVNSTQTVYMYDSLGELGEDVGGFMAVLGSFGVLCCGGFFLLLGGIFALTLKDPAVIMVAGGVPQQMMGAQPMQQQAAPVQQQYQQPPQGGL